MRIKLIKCGICSEWYAPNHGCPICGARHRRAFIVRPDGTCEPRRVYYLNARGIEMVRGVPPPVDSIIKRLVKHLGGEL